MSNPTLRVHPKFLCLAAMLNISQALARGLLECLWDAASHSGEPDIGNAHAIEMAACWTGEPGQLCSALLQCGCGRAGFIEEIPGKAGLYRLHDLIENSPADMVRQWVHRQDRIAKGTTVSEIREIAARARAAKANHKTSDPPLDINAGAALPKNFDDCNHRKPSISPAMASPTSAARQTTSSPPPPTQIPVPSHYIPRLDEIQPILHTIGFSGDPSEFISEYRTMPITGPEQPDSWQSHLIKWAMLKTAEWKRDAEDRCERLIASARR